MYLCVVCCAGEEGYCQYPNHLVELVDLLLKKLSGKKDDDDDDDEEEDLKSTEMQKMLPLEPKNGEMA